MVQPATQPSSGWYIEVTNGIGSSSFDTLNLVCADLTSIQGDPGQPRSSTVQFTQGVGPSMNASGKATFTLAKRSSRWSLTVQWHRSLASHRSGVCEPGDVPESVQPEGHRVERAHRRQFGQRDEHDGDQQCDADAKHGLVRRRHARHEPD